MKRILVIKLGALGDFVQAFQPFAAIRTHHPNAVITLLTTAPFADLAKASPWFDRVKTDSRPAWWDLARIMRLRRALQRFDMVYDLQTSARSAWYYRLAGRPPWSGIAAGCSHPHDNPRRDAMHTVERQVEQLAAAGIVGAPEVDLRWLTPPSSLALPPSYAMLMPGAAAHRPKKRWPVDRFAALAAHLIGRGETPLVVGTALDAPLARAIQEAAPGARDLTGRTNLVQLAALAAGARIAIGNDTGPMHLAAAMGTPCVVLFSADSDPALAQPRGRVTVLRESNLADLPMHRVAEALPPAQ